MAAAVAYADKGIQCCCCLVGAPPIADASNPEDDEDDDDDDVVAILVMIAAVSAAASRAGSANEVPVERSARAVTLLVDGSGGATMDERPVPKPLRRPWLWPRLAGRGGAVDVWLPAAEEDADMALRAAAANESAACEAGRASDSVEDAARNEPNVEDTAKDEDDSDDAVSDATCACAAASSRERRARNARRCRAAMHHA